mmetsp:Transcript_7409/g.20929  ORF Transcript_7409/g.20929 Transcript_7409/m.20929 type:complete len:96 (+) Transcript_7409:165-452(+)
MRPPTRPGCSGSCDIQTTEDGHRCMQSSTLRTDCGSSAEVGSSSSSTAGLRAMAIANITRCACPPDSSCHGWLRTSCSRPISWMIAGRSPRDRPR